MATTLSQTLDSNIKNWWISLLLGVLYLFAGFWVFRTPLESYITLSIVFSAFILVSGIFEIAFSVSTRKEMQGWGWYLAGGILDLIIGSLLITHPGMTMVILPFFIGFWLLFRGILAIGVSLDLNSLGVSNWVWLLATGILILLFSFLLLANPIFAGLSIVYMTAFAFVFMGIFRIFLAFDLNLKRMKKYLYRVKEDKE